MNVLQVRNLVKHFPSKEGKIVAVDKVSFEVKKGEIFGLLGVNGAGKSTTINILSGLLLPDAGTVEILGKNFFQHEIELKHRFNVATAYYGLSQHLTVWQNLKVYATLYHVPNPEQKIQELGKKFVITHRFKAKVRSLSSGERTRIVLVKALLNDPELLFLDECTVGLDPDMAELTRRYLKEYNKEKGCSIVFTSHYMGEVEQLCHRIAFMDQGRIVKVGTAEDLLKEMKTQRVHLHFSQNIEKAIAVLKKEKISYTISEKGKISFNIKNEERVLFPLLEKFTVAKVPFDDMHLEKPTLEEYFIQRSRR